MPLTLQLVNETTLPDGGPVSIQISGKRGIDIGRAAHLDWTLPDPTRYISSRHCEIRYKDGGYWLHDVSTNGTFLNGADHRMREPQRLRNGDRFMIGQYIVAVTLEGEEANNDDPRGAARPPVQALNDQDWWKTDGDVPAPIDPKQLRPASNSAPINPDFLDWAADVPDPLQGPALYQRAPTRPMPVAKAPDMDWAEGPPSQQPTPPPPPPMAPAPRRPGADMKEAAPSPAATPPVDAVSRSAPLPVDSGASAEFLRQLAQAAGLPEDVWAQKDPSEIAQQIGTVLLLLVDNLMQLLRARQQAKRHAHSSIHTIIQATDNNPLKFCPSTPDALRILFGPTTSSYLDAHRAIAEGFEDLKVHQIKTYSAMQHALAMVIADLDPKRIERETDGGAGIGGLLQPRKAKLWDAYEARWEAKIGGEPIEAFMRYFAECYDNQR